MNRAWMALAGLAALAIVGAAVHFADFTPERLRTVTGPLSARECAAWREQAERFERRQAGWFAVYEGFALLQGVCLPQDPDRGRALIEGAFAAGLDEMLVIPYAEALATSGDIARAGQWLLLAVTANQLHLERTDRFYSERDFHMRLTLDRRTRVGSAPEEWDIWYPRVRALLDRPPILPKLESEFLHRTIRSLARIRETQGNLLLDEVQRSGRILDFPASLRDGAILMAASCGDTEALRRQAQYFLAGELEYPRGLQMAGRIAWLHASTGTEAETLAKLADRLGLSSSDPRISAEAAFFGRYLQRYCASAPNSASRPAR